MEKMFQKATKGKKPVRLVLGGPSGAGKTYTALTFAKHLEEFSGKPTAAVDTEHYRLYSL
jgi:adenylylsulfate kinase-like enzyme